MKIFVHGINKLILWKISWENGKIMGFGILKFEETFLGGQKNYEKWLFMSREENGILLPIKCNLPIVRNFKLKLT